MTQRHFSVTAALAGALVCMGLFAGDGLQAAEITAAPSGKLQARMTQPITANFQEVDFVSAIDFLAETGGINIILSEKSRALGKPVTMHLVDMVLRRVLEHILKGQGLFFRYDGDTIWVATRDEMESEPMETRVFFLEEGLGLYATFENLTGTRQSVALQATGVSQMRTIRDVLDEVVPSVGGSSIVLDERSGALVVTHVPYYHQQIRDLLDQLDVPPDQVMIEARFIEITIDDDNEWSIDGLLTGNVILSTNEGPDGTSGAGVQLSTVGTTIARGTGISFTNSNNQSTGLNLTLQGLLTGTQYQALLHALSKRTKTRTLSVPRIMTLNNQTATIKIVTEFVYATRYEASVTREDLNNDGDFNDTVNGTRETRFVNVPQDFVTKDLGITLHVTPTIGYDRRTITLALKPEVTEKKTDDSFGGEITLPRFTARDLETTVVVENGHTVMLGGLMKDTTSITVTRVPLLGSLPILGKLFRKEAESVERSNLMIFVTANIVNPSGAHLALRN